LKCTSQTEKLNGIYLNAETSGKISFSYAGVSNITEKVTLFTATFSRNEFESTQLTITIANGDISDASLNDVSYSVYGGEID
jgi:hypothetical protein